MKRRASTRRISTCPGPISSIASCRRPPVALGAAQLPDDPQRRPPGRHRLRLDPPGRPGHRVRRARASRRRRSIDPANIVKLAIEGGCNCVVSTLGTLGAVAQVRPQDPVHGEVEPQRVPHLPDRYDQIMFASVEQAFEMGAIAVGATVYFGSDESTRRSRKCRRPSPGRTSSAWSPCCGATRATRLQDAGQGLPRVGRPDRSGQPPRRDDPGRHHQAEDGGEQRRVRRAQHQGEHGKIDKRVYSDLVPGDHPIEMTRYQLANCYMGRMPLINSGGASGKNDFADAVRTAVINKRAGGMGLIAAARRSSGRWPRAPSCCTRSRTSTSIRRSRWRSLRTSASRAVMSILKARARTSRAPRSGGRGRSDDGPFARLPEADRRHDRDDGRIRRDRAAAPQVHESVRLFVAGVEGSGDNLKIVPFVNPVITPVGTETTEDWEGA